MALTIDGTSSASGISVTSIPVTLTTGKTNDIIVLVICNRRGFVHTTVSGVSDTAGLTWAKRSSITLDDAVSNFFMDFEIWWGASPRALSSDIITVTFGAAIIGSVLAFGVNGASVSSPWDSNVSLPATASSAANSAPSLSGVSTTTANSLAFSFLYSPAYGIDPGPGTINGSTASQIVSQLVGGVVSAADFAVNGILSSASANNSHSITDWLFVVDAIAPAHVPQVFSDSFSSSVAASDQLATAMTMGATLSGSVTAAGVNASGNVFVNSLFDNVTAADFMIGGLIWNGTPPPPGSWTGPAAPSGTWTPSTPAGGTWTKR